MEDDNNKQDTDGDAGGLTMGIGLILLIRTGFFVTF